MFQSPRFHSNAFFVTLSKGLLVLCFFACSKKDSTVFSVGSLVEKTAKLYINPAKLSSSKSNTSDSGPTKLHIYYVNSMNSLTSINFEAAPDFSFISFPWTNELLKQSSIKSSDGPMPMIFLQDTLLSMGKSLSSVFESLPILTANQAFTHQFDLVLSNVDLAPASLNQGTKGLFQRVTVRLQRQDNFSAEKIVELNKQNAPVEWNEVLFAVGFVTNNQKVALSKVNVFAYNWDETQSNRGLLQQIWTLPQFRPITFQSNSDGKALVGPLFQDAQTARFQWFAQTNGNCLALSNPILVKDLNEAKTLDSLSVQSCEKSLDFGSQLKNNFSAKVTINPARTQTTDPSGKITYFTNQAKEEFDLLLLEPVLRGFRVARYELTDAIAKTTELEPLLFENFQPKINIDTVDKFSKSGGTTGRFLVEFFSIPASAQDQSVGQVSIPFASFLFDKRTALPSFTLTGSSPDTTIVAGNGTKNAINSSGFPYALKIQSTKCSEGGSFGALIGDFNLQPYEYFPCTNSEAQIPWSSLKSPLLGEQTIKVSFKDVYNNISVDDPETTRIKVTVL